MQEQGRNYYKNLSDKEKDTQGECKRSRYKDISEED